MSARTEIGEEDDDDVMDDDLATCVYNDVRGISGLRFVVSFKLATAAASDALDALLVGFGELSVLIHDESRNA